jgi:hypothetical protein
MQAALGKVARLMNERLEIRKKRYADGVILFVLGTAVLTGLVVLARVGARDFGELLVSYEKDAEQTLLVGGFLKACLGMGLVGLLALIYWRVQRMLSPVPEMVIDAQGILVRMGGREQLLSWDDVVALRLDTKGRSRSLRVSPAPDLVLGASTGRVFAWMDIVIAKGQISVDFQDVVEFVRRVAPADLSNQLSGSAKSDAKPGDAP